MPATTAAAPPATSTSSAAGPATPAFTITSAAGPIAYGVTGSAFSLQLTIAPLSVAGVQFAADGLPAGLAIDPRLGRISGTPAAATLPDGAWVTVTGVDPSGNVAAYSFRLRVWQAVPGVTVLAGQWSGAAAVQAGRTVTAHATAHATGTGTASRLTFASDFVATDAPYVPGMVDASGAVVANPAGGSFDTAPVVCPGAGPAGNTVTLAYFGRLWNPLSQPPVWNVVTDTSGAAGVRPRFTFFDPRNNAVLPAAASVACAISGPADGTGVTRLVSAVPGIAVLYVVDITPPGVRSAWSAIDGPPTRASLPGLPGVPDGPGPTLGAPALVSRAAGEYDLAAVGADGTSWLRHYAPTTGWTSWTSLGGISTSGLSMTSRTADTLDIAQRGTDGAVYLDTITGTSASGWTRIGGLTLASTMRPAVTATDSRAIDSRAIDIVAVGTDGHPARLHYSRAGNSGCTGQLLSPLGTAGVWQISNADLGQFLGQTQWPQLFMRAGSHAAQAAYIPGGCTATLAYDIALDDIAGDPTECPDPSAAVVQVLINDRVVASYPATVLASGFPSQTWQRKIALQPSTIAGQAVTVTVRRSDDFCPGGLFWVKDIQLTLS